MNSQGWDEASHVHSQLGCSLVDQRACSVEELQLQLLVLTPAAAPAACTLLWHGQRMWLGHPKKSG